MITGIQYLITRWGLRIPAYNAIDNHDLPDTTMAEKNALR